MFEDLEPYTVIRKGDGQGEIGQFSLFQFYKYSGIHVPCALLLV